MNYPSCTNCQPWSFTYKENKLYIFFDSNRAKHPLDFSGIASALSLGCLIEAIDLSASSCSLNTKIEYYHFDANINSCWAAVEFIIASRSADSLAYYIKERSTDRRAYNKGCIPTAKIQSTIAAITSIFDIKFYFHSTMSEMFIKYIMRSEELLIDQSSILFKILEWTRFSKKQCERTGDGLTLKSLGVSMLEVLGWLMLKHLPNLNTLLKSKLINEQSLRVRHQIQSSAGIILITIPKRKPELIPIAGRAMYRAWLELTHHGFGVQPLSLATLPVYGVKEGYIDKQLSEKWKNFYDISEDVLRSEINFPYSHVPLFMIRTGKTNLLPNEARTYRKPISEVFQYIES